jgi:hypothetical protein
MHKKKRQTRPDERVGKFCIVAGGAMLYLALFLPRLDFGQRCFAASSGLMGWVWGAREIAAAKKWKQESEGGKGPSYIFTIRKPILLVILSGLLLLLAFLVRFVWINP